MKKKKNKKPIVLGFLAVYLLGIILTTKFVGENYAIMQLQTLGGAMEYFIEEFSALEKDSIDSNLASYLLSYTTELNGSKTNQYAAAIYDGETGEKIAQTGLLITDGYEYEKDLGREEVKVYQVGPCMIKEDQSKLAKFIFETRKAEMNEDYPPYYYNVTVLRESKAPVEIEVLKVTWNKERDDGSYNQMTSEWSEKELEWHWENPVIQAGEKQEISTYQMSAVVPNLAYGFSGWKRWQSDEHLQNLPELLSEWKPVKTSYSILTPIKVADCIELDNGCVLVYHQTAKPLLAAMDHLKYVYLGSLIIVFICIRKVLGIMEETNNEREKVEEMRRDFSNAIAHEMKTPLGVVRGFAENLKENTNEEKQEYYIDQIVNQTEHMDEMIKEMIYVSKLDSDKVVLNKTEISMKKLLEEAMETLRNNIEEKRLNIIYYGLADFVVKGDLQYLKKAVWNIVSNAVEYNQIGGRIEISFEQNSCKIRNTGKQIAEEDLEQVFDMFYTGNKSRTSGEKHLGIGLYLTKKIFDLHGLIVRIGNIEEGVEVTIMK